MPRPISHILTEMKNKVRPLDKMSAEHHKQSYHSLMAMSRVAADDATYNKNTGARYDYTEANELHDQANEHAKKHFEITGKLIYDKEHTGPSPHVTKSRKMAESLDEAKLIHHGGGPSQSQADAEEEGYHRHMDASTDNFFNDNKLKGLWHHKKAEVYAARYHRVTGKKIVDPHYRGDSPHVSNVKESFDEEKLSPSQHKRKFWSHINGYFKHWDKGPEGHRKAEDHVNMALSHAKAHFEKTGKKINVGGGLDGLESKYITHD